MCARRDDITGSQRARIAIEVLYPHRPWGTVTRLAREYEVARKTIYDIRNAGERVLTIGLEPGPHGPQSAEKTILVDRNRLVRGNVRPYCTTVFPNAKRWFDSRCNARR